MGILKFELKEDHLKLIKNLQWTLEESKFIVSKEPAHRNKHNLPINSPFGGDDVYEDMFLILVGKTDREIDVMSDNPVSYTQDEKDAFGVLLNDLPTAIEIVLFTQSFELGTYRTKYHIKNWKKV